MTKSHGSWRQLTYRRKYALEVTRQEGVCVKEARCKFCKYFSRQVLLNNRKRGPHRIDQFYAVLFRADLMLKCVEGRHVVKWANYVPLSSDE
jgi:hypothetical protein